MNEDRFENLLDEMRNEAAPAGLQEATVARVWDRLQHPACAEFSAEMARYQSGELLESRRLLMEDHLSRCAACRRTLAEMRGESPANVTSIAASPRWRQWSKWAVAAGVAMMTAYASRDFVDAALAPSGPGATVESMSGRLIAADGAALAAGAKLADGDVVRTGAGSRAALRLRDGSVVEVNERSQLFIRSAWSGQRVHLDRGDAIVQAAKQRRGRLQLITRDATASVKGTVFGVSTGVAGSLVSVVEGSVEVEQGGLAARLLKAGQQSATAEAVQAGGVREAIAWSPNAEKYYALLAELATLEEQIAAVATPNLRTQAKLLPRMIGGAWLYGAVPNSSDSLRRSFDLVERRARESAVFKEWWESAGQLKAVIEQLQSVSGMLGDEVVFMMGEGDTPAIVAEVQPGREAALKLALEKIVVDAKAQSAYSLSGGLLVISEDAAHLAKAQGLLGKGAGSPFAQEIAKKYQRGAGWLLAIDAGTLIAREHSASDRAVLDATGAGRVKFAFLEQRGIGGRDDNEAAVGFQGARQGVASWLATPGAFGSSEYISTKAIAAGAASVRNPRQAFDELIAALGRVQPSILEELRQFERETGLSVAGDFAASLGTDFSISVENAQLPVPGWVSAMEVYSPAALDASIKRLVDAFNKQAAAGQKLTMAEETVNGRKWSSVKAAAMTQHWTYDRGYLVTSNDRAIATRAIATRAAGTPLVRSAAFRERTPATPSVHNSGFVWINTRGALGELLGAAGMTTGPLSNLLSSRNPVLIMVNGETERIAAFSRTRLTSLLLDLLMTTGAPPSGEPGKKMLKKRIEHAIGD